MQPLFLSSILAAALAGCVLGEAYCEGPLKAWHKFGDNCYLFQATITKRLSYYDAEDHCRTKGAHLVSILSEEENTFIKDTLQSHTYYYGRMWIGLNTLKGPENHEWSDGQTFGYKNIIDKKQYKKESCFILYGKEGGWRPEHCGLHYTPLCKRAATDVEPSPIPPFTPDIPEGNCPKGWTQFGHRCYQYFGQNENQRLKFKEAKAACISLGEDHDLVSIHSMEEQAFLTQSLYAFGTSAWIGFNYIESDEIGHDIIFGWTDNSRENFTYWAPANPPRGTWKYCAYLNDEGFGKGEWIADYCDSRKRGYICQRPPDASVPEPEKPTSTCNKGYTGYRDSCYQYYSTPRVWEEAENVCEKEGGHLVAINDAFEQNFLYGLIDARFASLWTGLRNIPNTRIFKWSNGEPLYYSNWENFRPVFTDLKYSCVSTSAISGMQMKVENCNTKNPFICEIQKGSPAEFPVEVIGECASTGSSWIDIGDRYCYQEGIDPKTAHWGDTSRYCMSKGMEMVSISSEHQMRTLFTYLWKSNTKYWLGLLRSFDKSTFIWSDGSSLNYTNWAENEPSEWSKNYKKDCVTIDMNDLKWYPTECSEWSGYLCRTKKAIPGHTVRVARSQQSYQKTEVAAESRKEIDPTTQSSGPVAALIAGIVCLGLSVFVAALIFAWRRRNEGELPTIVPAQVPDVSSNENSHSLPRY